MIETAAEGLSLVHHLNLDPDLTPNITFLDISQSFVCFKYVSAANQWNQDTQNCDEFNSFYQLCSAFVSDDVIEASRLSIEEVRRDRNVSILGYGDVVVGGITVLTYKGGRLFNVEPDGTESFLTFAKYTTSSVPGNFLDSRFKSLNFFFNSK